MRIYVILLLAIYHLHVIYGQGIGLFNNTIILDNSTIVWSSFNIFQCTESSIEINTNSCVSTTTTSSVQTTSTTSMSTISVSTTVQTVIVYKCADGAYGANCNISSDVCKIATPCLNGATCYTNSSLTLGYSCQCATGFTGDHCETDQRVCTENTCWNNGTCLEINSTTSGSNITSFTCECASGYDGTHCQVTTNMCSNITCENNGICVSTYLNWSCTCLDSTLYSGVYCQDKSSALATKQAISQSFGIAAIIALCGVIAFIVFMDVLKYVFKIDPVDRESHRIKLEQEKEEQKKRPKKQKINNDRKTLVTTHFSTI